MASCVSNVSHRGYSGDDEMIQTFIVRLPICFSSVVMCISSACYCPIIPRFFSFDVLRNGIASTHSAITVQHSQLSYTLFRPIQALVHTFWIKCGRFVSTVFHTVASNQYMKFDAISEFRFSAREFDTCSMFMLFTSSPLH